MTSELKTRILKLVKADLERVEQSLEDELKPNLDLVRQIAGHLLFSGGKRMRPLLMIHSARMCGYHTGFEIRFSTIFEYLHTATLLHDDVVDEAQKRRGKEVAHGKWGVPEVVLTGDFLMARALGIATEISDPELISVIAGITRHMSEGEIDQMVHKGNIHLTRAHYMDVIYRKTAVLIQGACKSGAILAKATRSQITALTEYGYHMGMAFQMVDDLLDYTANAGELGKTPGADIREGKLTLPLIVALENADPADHLFMEKMIKNPEFTPEEFQELKNKLYRYNGIQYTKDLAIEYVNKAKECLDSFEDSSSRQILTVLADYTVARNV